MKKFIPFEFVIAFAMALIPIAFSSHLADNYTIAKWLSIYLTGAIISVALFNQGVKVKIARPFAWLLLATAALYILSMVLNRHASYRSQIVDWLCFSVIALAAYDAAFKTSKSHKVLLNANEWATIAVLTYGFSQVFGVEWFSDITHSPIASSFFGFQNMCAEFLGVSILLQFYRLIDKKDSFVDYLRELLLAGSVSFLFILLSRSALLATAIGVAVLIFYLGRQRLLRWVRIAALSAGVVFFLYQTAESLKDSSFVSEGVRQTKAGNWEIRQIRWMNTLKMIADKPLGVGPGNYEFGYLPWHSSSSQDPESTEAMVVRSPHNGYLEAAAESGILFALTLTFFIFALLRRLWRGPVADRKLSYLMIALALYLMVDAFFAFPLENAYPFFIAAMVAGVSLRLTTAETAVFERSIPRVVFLLPAALIAVGAFFFFTSKFYEFNRHDSYPEVALACDRWPENWRACLRKSEHEITQKNLNASRTTLEGIIRRTPEHFVALRNLGFIHMNSGNAPMACSYFSRYVQLFNGLTQIVASRDRACSTRR